MNEIKKNNIKLKQKDMRQIMQQNRRQFQQQTIPILK